MRVIIKKGNSADPKAVIMERSFRGSDPACPHPDRGSARKTFKVSFQTKSTSLVLEEEIKTTRTPTQGAG
jgi:hypothetical protein